MRIEGLRREDRYVTLENCGRTDFQQVLLEKLVIVKSQNVCILLGLVLLKGELTMRFCCN